MGEHLLRLGAQQIPGRHHRHQGFGLGPDLLGGGGPERLRLFLLHPGHRLPAGQLTVPDQAQDVEIEPLHQRQSPTVPGLGAGGHRVGHRQKIEHLEGLDVVDPAGAEERGLLVLDVPAGRGLGQKEVLPDQEADGLHKGRRIALFREDRPDDGNPFFRMASAGLPLAHVVEEGGPEERPGVGQAGENLPAEGPESGVVWRPEGFHRPDGPDGVGVHGKEVVVVVLNPVIDGRELRDEPAEKAGVHHIAQDVVIGVGRREDSLEGRHRRNRLSEAVVHQLGHVPDQPPGLGAQRNPQPGGGLENPHEDLRGLGHRLGGGKPEHPPGHLQPRRPDISFHRRIIPPGPPEAFQLVDKDRVLLLHSLHPDVEVPEEPLHRLLAVFGPVAEMLGHLLLIVEMELIHLPSGQIVEVASDVPDKVEGLGHLPLLGVGEVAVILEVPELPDVRGDPAHPEHGVVVPEPALAFLEVRLEEIG